MNKTARGKLINAEKPELNGTWVYGYYAYSGNTHKHYILRSDPKAFQVFAMLEVDPTTVGLWIGENDKNGKPIYEGDYDQNGDVVTWCDRRTGWAMSMLEENHEVAICHSCDGDFDINDILDDFVVSRNIHDDTGETIAKTRLEEVRYFYFVKNREVYSGQYKAFIKFYEQGNEQECWSIILGDWKWLKSQGSQITWEEISQHTTIGKRWYKNGQLEWQGNFEDGKLHGLWQEWYENGQLEWQYNYTDGELHGLWQEWYEDGQLRINANYTDGKLHGLLQTWHEDGRLVTNANYIEGVRQ